MRKSALVLFALVMQTTTLYANFSPRSNEASSQPEKGSICRELASIKLLPFRADEANDDRTYSALMRRGMKAVPNLIECITDETKMKDPRSAPKYDDFRVGDLAAFLLTRITKIDLPEMMPETVQAKWADQGVYAYFEYVRNPNNRQLLQRRWREWLKANATLGMKPQH